MPLNAALSEAGDPQVIDLAILAGLLSFDRHKVRKFAFKFLQTTRDGFDEMEEALAAGNIERVRQLGHRIKSSARTVGAFGMGELCMALEDLPRTSAEHELAEARALLGRLWPLLEKITEHIMTNTSFTSEA